MSPPHYCLAVGGRLALAAALAAVVLVGAGCGSPAPPTGALKVTVIYAGGPPLPDGGTPHFPVAGAGVDVAGQNTSVSAVANKTGVATFRLSAGRYYVHVPTCGSLGKVEVTISPAKSTPLHWICPIP